MVHKGERASVLTGIFCARFAALRPGKPKSGCREQLRASLRRKEVSPQGILTAREKPCPDACTG
jgi:hypothetical protein